jgi:hypothetical protein
MHNWVLKIWLHVTVSIFIILQTKTDCAVTNVLTKWLSAWPMMGALGSWIIYLLVWIWIAEQNRPAEIKILHTRNLKIIVGKRNRYCCISLHIGFSIFQESIVRTMELIIHSWQGFLWISQSRQMKICISSCTHAAPQLSGEILMDHRNEEPRMQATKISTRVELTC